MDPVVMSSLVTIPVGDEGIALAGRVAGAPDGDAVVLCHPHPAFGGTMDTPIVAAIADALVAAGRRVLRFNFRGVGGSGGRASGGLVEDRDVRAACAWLRADTGRDVALAGYSFGALMALRALARGERVRAFAGLGLPTTIIGDDPARNAECAAGFAAEPSRPTLMVSGDRDQFCEVPHLRRLLADCLHARVEILAGVDHFPSGAALDEVRHLFATVL